MIPEQYWQILRRWYWIIGLLGLLGGIAGLFLLPIGLGSGTSAYDASVTLQVSRFVSFGGTVTAGSGTGGAALLADYTTSITEMAKTAQFQARLRVALEADGLDVTEANLAEKLRITADRGLLRIYIGATASNAKDAETLAEEAANVLMEQVQAEETRITQSLVTNTDQQRAELLDRLSELNNERQQKLESLNATALRAALDDLVRRGDVGTDLSGEFRTILQDLALISGDVDLAVINSQTDALEKQLSDLAQAQESLSSGLLESGQPVFVLNPAETVATEPESTLRKRDMLVLGGGAGLIMGWLVANMAEHVRNGRGLRREEEEGDT